MFLQICHVNANRDMGSVHAPNNGEILAEDAPRMALDAEKAYALSYDLYDGDTYELRIWDGEDCISSDEYRYEGGTFHPVI